ncbi:MAG: hypothetical protein WA733_02190 [Methylocystis sp.]
MMAGQRRVRKIVETKLAIVAKITVAMRLSVVMAIAHDMFAAALRTANALRPARLTHKFETFRVIEQRRQIDQNTHGSNLSRISREPYGFSQLRSAKALHAESFRRTAHLRRRAVRLHHLGTRDEPF